MSRSRLIIVLVVVAAVAGGAWLLLGSPGGPGSAEPSPTLGPVPESTTVAADARAVPARRVELSPPAGGGVVSEVRAKEGDRVTKGHVLLRLDGRLAEAEYDQAQAAQIAAQRRSAQAGFASAQATAQEVAASAAVDQARAAVRSADATRDGTPSGTAARRAANAEVDRARASLRIAQAQANAAVQATQVAVMAERVALKEEDRTEAALVAAKAALDDLSLVAPFTGTVVSLDAVVGETVVPGAPVARMADLSSWQFETIDLDEASIGRIREGAGAVISVDAFAGVEIPARVVSIDRFGEASAGDIVYTVVLEPTGEVPEGLRWNMTASAQIETEG